ncbi:MAG: hypothetical protein JWQ25_2690, partial [Daejeonella sp.]|nr:hypothetical protein [Daejeonella sp.]
MSTPVIYSKIPYSTYAFLFGIFPIVIGISVLLGWSLEIDFLKSWFTGIIPMNPLTSIIFILIGTIVTLKRSKISFKGKELISHILLYFVAVILIQLLFTIFFSANLRLDRLIFKNTLGSNKMSEATLVSFVFIVCSLLFAQSKKPRLITLSQYFILLPLYISLIFSCSYLFNLSQIQTTIIGAPLAVSTSICLVFLNVAILLMHPNEGFVKHIIQNSTGGNLARKTLPLMVIVPLLSGFLRLMGEHYGFYNTEFGTALFVVTVIMLSCSHLIYHCTILNRIDVERSRMENNLR